MRVRKLLLRSCIEEGSKFGVEVIAAEIGEPADIEPAFAAMAKRSADGFVAPPDPTILAHRKLIVELTTRHRLPGVYALSGFVDGGGLISYGISLPGLFRQAAARREIGGPSRSAPYQIRIDCQSQSREGSWHHDPPNAACDGR